MTLHPILRHVGKSWVWVVMDFYGVMVAKGKAARREKARQQMGKTVRKLRKK